MPDRLTREQATLWAAIRRGIGAVDALFRRIARAVRDALTPYRERERLTHADRRAILRAVDAILAPVFGATRRAAITADLTVTVARLSADAGEGVFRRAYDRLARIIERRDPALWRRVRLAAMLNPAERGLPAVVAMFDGPAIRAERLRRARFLDPVETWRDRRGYRLSDRVWKQGKGVRSAIDDRLRLAVTRGDDPIRVARELERYLDPAWQPLRYGPDGRIVVDLSRKQVYTMMPRGGHGSNAARRLARTEIMRAYGLATIESAKEIPGVRGIQWRLSGSHPEDDSCTDIANRDVGLGRGVYPVNDVPQYPQHPNELCVLSHAHMPDDDLVDLIVKQYGGVTA
ncbi:MAG TPA: hypothetical protein VFK15_05875 [Burkholderiales bacterium]|nr:hypothetical protein [Burkholderiales bacterium]